VSSRESGDVMKSVLVSAAGSCLEVLEIGRYTHLSQLSSSSWVIEGMGSGKNICGATTAMCDVEDGYAVPIVDLGKKHWQQC
jgi:hypothetical protein